jgi:predicted metalloendopeptidase
VTVLLPACIATAQESTALAPVTSAAAPAPSRLKSGIELASVDRNVRPQDDFYRHVNGGWLAYTPIPSDKAYWAPFSQLRDDTDRQVRTIIEAASRTPGERGSEAQKVGDFYSSFMNESRVETLGSAPLQAELARIDALMNKDEVPALMAHFARIGVDTPFTATVSQDAKNSSQYIAYLSQSGLGLPDRDYYLLGDAKFEDLRTRYVAHVENTLALAKTPEPKATATRIVALEALLAQKQWSKVDSRDVDKTYNRYELAKLNALTPGFAWRPYLEGTCISGSPGVVVEQPDYFTAWAAILEETPLPTLQSYFRWQVLRAYAPYLNKAFVDENFAFYGKTLSGIPENRPRWQRGVQTVQTALGEAIGKVYVQRHFPPEAKARMDVLVANLLRAYGQSIRELDWMSEETKQKALVKLSKFRPKIGYPSKWRDYSPLTIQLDELVANVMRAHATEHDYQTGKLGRPIDREEWDVPPQTVNAFYNALQNEIVFPAAYLQPPYFDMTADDAVNYGAIGSVIGHEIGHGFDDQGSKFDGDGNLQSWWTARDRQKFDERTHRLIEQFNAYCPLPDLCVNGAQTVGENIADLGGLSIAYKAYKLALGGREAPVIDGLSGDQRFFMGFAQTERMKLRDEFMVRMIKTGAHAPGEYRCNGVLTNLPAFYAAYGVKEGDRLYLPPEKRVKIW